jgi:actin-related protein
MNHLGDDVNAIVLDVGHSTTKVGHSGEDMPRSVFSTRVGHIETDAEGDVAMDGKKTRRSVLGDVKIAAWQPGLDLKSPLHDGVGI